MTRKDIEAEVAKLEAQKLRCKEAIEQAEAQKERATQAFHQSVGAIVAYQRILETLPEEKPKIDE